MHQYENFKFGVRLVHTISSCSNGESGSKYTGNINV